MHFKSDVGSSPPPFNCVITNLLNISSKLRKGMEWWRSQRPQRSEDAEGTEPRNTRPEANKVSAGMRPDLKEKS